GTRRRAGAARRVQARRALPTRLPPARLSLERARHFLARVDLEDVPGLNAVDAVHADAALQPGENLADFVLESLQRADGALADDLVAATHSHLGPAHDLSLRDVRAADRPQLGDDEDLPDLGLAQRRLADLGREPPVDGRLDVVDGVV